jgi:thiol-disulfide isomerase/thioredoxin
MRNRILPLRKSRPGLFIGSGLAIVLGVWWLREPLRNWITRNAALANPSPPAELIEETIETSPDRATAILAAWNTGKIVQRQVAIRAITRTGAPTLLTPELESITLAGALDADMNVRESALALLQSLDHPALAPLAAAQLRDPDPQIRLLGLNYLKGAPAAFGVPTLISLLNDDDPFVVVSALKLLETWSGQNFGVRLSEAIASENERTGLTEFSEVSHEKARSGAARARLWWAEHQAEFPARHIEVPRKAISGSRPIPAGDFSLRALDGSRVRLTDYRGKVVLLNFWTTWCTACVGEMPALIALQKRHPDRLAVIGVSLDFVPDSHGHIGGHPAVEERTEHAEESDSHERNSASLKKVRGKVARTAKARGINYPILLDENNAVGGQFNGGELPTTVILDPQGNVRRRFVGARSLPIFEAMIAEASQPERMVLKPPLQSPHRTK